MAVYRPSPRAPYWKITEKRTARKKGYIDEAPETHLGVFVLSIVVHPTAALLMSIFVSRQLDFRRTDHCIRHCGFHEFDVKERSLNEVKQ